MLRSTLIGALLSVLIANPVLASDFYAKTAGWTIIGDDESCGMYMQFEGPGETQMLFLKYPDGHFGASVLNYNWTAVEGSDYKIRYTLNSSSYNTEHSKGTKSDGASGFISFFNKELESDLVKGSSLHIYLDDTLVDRLSLAGTSAAIAMVNRCLVGVSTKIAAAEREKRRWSDIPKDPFASSTRTNSAPLPRGSPAAWASTNDYPTKALREHREGRVAVTLSVGADGRVLACKVDESSGSPDLDEATCSNFQRRARFDPAIDAKGAPTTGTWSQAMNWVIPDQ